MKLARKLGVWVVALVLVLSSLAFSAHTTAASSQDVTRGEYIQAIVTALDYELGDGKSQPFTDVDTTLAPFVESALQHGLVKKAATFKPNEKLTREHAFLIAARAVNTDQVFEPTLLDTFKDKNQFITKEIDGLAKSVGLGLLKGYEDGTAKPQQIVSKGQVQKIIDRVLAIDVQPSKDTVALRILGTSDLHTNFVNYDYYQDKETQEFGLAKTGVLIEEARAENPNTLLFDNGDLIQGTPLGAYKVSVEPLKKGETHPAFAAFEALGYDAMSLGNHEFNFGLDYLDLVIEGTTIPIINSSVYAEDTKDNRYTPYLVLDREVVDGQGNKQNLKVGVIGVVTPGIMKWDKALLEGKVTAKDAVEAVKESIPKVQALGADIIVVIAHSGIGDEVYTRGEENATYQLSELAGVDAILTGHDHGTFPGKDYAHLKNVDMDKGTINGTPVVMPGKFGSHLGIIDLELQKDGDKWTVLNGQTSVRAVDKESNKVSQKVLDAVKDVHNKTVDYVRSPVGKTTAEITSYFALVQDDPSIQIVTNAQKWYVEKEIASTKYANLPVLSAGAPFKAGGRNGANYYTEIPAGEIAIKNVADLYVYDNTVAALVLTGADVKEWLEMSAGQFNQVDPASTAEQNIINDDYRTYNFDVIDGLTYEIDITQPAKYNAAGDTIHADANRIVNLQFNGKPIDAKQQFVVVTNNYRASGNFPGVRNATDTIMYAYENREAIMDYMIEQKTIDPTADGNWKLSAIKGTPKLTFITSEKAQKFLPKNGAIQYIAPTEGGFAKFGLELK